jgi:hypothetical protein
VGLKVCLPTKIFFDILNLVDNYKIMDTRYRHHNQLVNRILILLHSNKLGKYWSNATGAVKTSNGHFQRYGLIGSPDIIGISNTGKFVGIEIKTGANSRQSKHQKNFEKMAVSLTALYFVVRSEEDFDKIKESLV